MKQHDDNIRRMADGLMQEGAQAQAAYENIARQNALDRRAALARSEQHRIEVINLCGRFATWATRHNIRYNSPSVLAPGWLLGEGDGPPSFSYSHQGVQAGGSSTYSLLVRSSGSINELVVNNVHKHRRRYHLFQSPYSVKFDRYDLSSIENSIARFSAKSRIPWR